MIESILYILMASYLMFKRKQKDQTLPTKYVLLLLLSVGVDVVKWFIGKSDWSSRRFIVSLNWIAAAVATMLVTSIGWEKPPRESTVSELNELRKVKSRLLSILHFSCIISGLWFLQGADAWCLLVSAFLFVISNVIADGVTFYSSLSSAIALSLLAIPYIQTMSEYSGYLYFNTFEMMYSLLSLIPFAITTYTLLP